MTPLNVPISTPLLRNMKHLPTFLALLLISLSGCIIEANDNNQAIRGSGPLELDTRNIDVASSIVMSIPGRLNVHQNVETALTIEAQPNLLPYIKTYINNETLYIETDKDIRLDPTLEININVLLPATEAITFAGQGQVFVDTLVTTALHITLAGSGDFDLASLNTERLEVVLAGEGTIHAKGIADEQAILIAGSGNMSAADLATKKATINITGSGNATLRVSDQLTTTIAGSGSVFYIGAPVLQTTIAGSGTVQPLADQ